MKLAHRGRLTPLVALLLAAPLCAQTVAQTAPKHALPEAVGNQPVAVLGFLDKRLGTSTFVTLKPGQNFRFGRLSGILRTCDKTAPYERPQSAAFVQVVEHVQPVGQKKPLPPKLVFSGWLFAESPSLNSFTHPVYDVWLRSCTIKFPDGPTAPAKRPAPAATTGEAKPAAPSPTPENAPAEKQPAPPPEG